MKARTVLALVVLFLFTRSTCIALFFLAGGIQAGNIDKAKLRELAYLPNTSAEFFFDFSSISGFSDESERTDQFTETESV